MGRSYLRVGLGRERGGEGGGRRGGREKRLRQAARRCDVGSIRKALQAGVSVHACDGDMCTPLHGAAEVGACDAVRVLLEGEDGD